MEKKIYETLNKVGMPCNVNGRKYTSSAVRIILERGQIPAIKELYPLIAKEHDTTPSRVERSIRHAVETTFSNSDYDSLTEVFGNAISRHTGKLTATAFIYGLAEYIINN